MKIYLLEDKLEPRVDAVIIAETSTEEEIENAINKATQNDDWEWEDIVKALPNDCKIYDRREVKTVYY